MRLDLAPKTLTELRAFTALDVDRNKKIFLTDEGKEGEFVYDSTDTTSADNIGTIIVTTSGGFRFKRKYKSDVYASWFIDTADSTGTSGTRERNAINRATTFSLAQTVCPTVILDNKRTWYVNTNAIYLDVATGKKITIKGEGNPIIDFLCTGNSETSASAVFRTSNSHNYPITDYNTANGAPVFTGSITGNVLTITAVTSGSLVKGMVIYDATSSLITSNTKILDYGTGTGGTGTYILTKSQTFSSATITGSAAFLAWNNRIINKGRIELKGITFDGNRNPANAGSNTVYSTPILFRQCEGIKISDCTFKNIPGSGLTLGISNNVEVFSNTFDSVFARNTNDNTGDAITVYAFCENVNISNNKITLTTGQSGRCGVSVDDFCKNAKVIDNEIIGYERGIHIETSRNTVVSNNTIQKSPIGILSAGSEQCSVTGNTIDGRDVVFPSTLAATANLFVYYDTDCLYADNIVYGSYTTQNGLYNSKFWGDRITVKGNVFKNQRLVNDFTNSVTSTTTNTIPLNLSSPVNLTFAYTSNPNLIWKVNQRLRASNATYIYVEGYVTAVSATSVSIQLDTTTGNNTSYSSWTLKYTELGSVWGYGSHNDNVYTDNVFENSHLLVDENNNTVVKDNVFKSSYVSTSSSSSTTGLNVKIIGNTFTPFPGDTYARSISVFNGKNPYVADNVLTNPSEYVIQNTGSTGGVFENNTYIKTDVGAAGNGFFFVDSSGVDTNINRTLRPNIIRDSITSETYYVGNTGANYFPTKVNLQVEATNTTITPNNDLYKGYVISALTSNLTINAPTGTWLNGQKYTFRIKDNGTSRTLTWDSAYRGIGGSLPTSTTISTTMYLEAVYNLADTKWDIKIFTAGSGDALTSNPLSQFAATTSAQLAGVISDETGTNLLVFNTSPTLVTPNLGTPASATLTNATGLPISTGVSGLGTGVATFLATPSSANLITAVTDETGTGSLVFATSPTLVTPILGTPTSGNLANCTFPTLNQNTTGSAATLTTPRTIGGVSFNGSANIVPQTIQSVNEAADTTCFPLFISASGSQSLQPLNNTAFTFNASTGALGATTLVTGGSGITIGSSVPFADSAGTLTLQNVDALDATTESTIEDAIDTLVNLTSIQGQTVTLTGAFIRSGAHSLTLTTTGTTSLTLPTTGTLISNTVTTLSSLVSIGTITTGTWNATAIGAGFGGTGQTTYAVGDLLQATASTTLSKLAAVATGNVLISGGVATASSWGKVGLTTHVSGTLPVANGGTNASSASITAFNNITGYTAAGASGTTSTNLVFSTSPTLTDPLLTVGTPGTLSVGYLGIPQNSQSAAYTCVMTDSGKHIYHPSADTTARTFTIPANSSVAYPIGTAITFINDSSAGVITIAITTDTLVLAGAGTTGSRTLAANGNATAVKITSTRWQISGVGLT